MSDAILPLPPDYAQWLIDLKQRILGARQRALLAVNDEQIRLYHHIGREILERQSRQGWGAKVIDRLAADLRDAFPDMKGFSSRNLKYMKAFAQESPDFLIGQQSAAQLPWFHIVTLITKIPDPGQRDWYARHALEQSWSRDTLAIQIKNQLHLRQGAAVTNFEKRLAPPQAGLAMQVLKDPYHFDFLGLGDEAQERDIENALIRHITRFLLELGARFRLRRSAVSAGSGRRRIFHRLALLSHPTEMLCGHRTQGTCLRAGTRGQVEFLSQHGGCAD